MKYYLLLVFILLATSIHAQNWAAPGEDWHYNISSLAVEGYMVYINYRGNK